MTLMSAGAPRRRTLLRPAAQNLSLSLVEHPSFKFRTFGAYDSGFLPTSPTSIDEESGESGGVVRVPSLIPHNPPIVDINIPASAVILCPWAAPQPQVRLRAEIRRS